MEFHYDNVLTSFPMAAVNKLPQPWGLKITEIYSLWLSSRGQRFKSVSLSQNQCVDKTIFSPETLEVNLPGLFQLPVAARIPRLAFAPFQTLPPWPHCPLISMCKFLCPPLKEACEGI